MPISKDEFERGEKLEEAEKRILSFLNKTPFNAYTAWEIMDALAIV